MKMCKYCNKEKELEDFPKKKRGGARCKSCVNLYAKQFYKENKERIVKNRQNHNIDKESRKEWYKNWEKDKMQNDPHFRMIKRLRLRHYSVLKGKLSTTKSLGCTKIEFVKHMESLFSEGMTWGNYGFGEGKWCIDHKIPVSLIKIDENGNLQDHELNLKILHYTNMQPLWFKDNALKSNKIL